MPKFKAEVKNMILSLLPSNIARYFLSNNDQAWRTNGHPDVFLSRAENLKCGGSRNLDSFYELMSRSSILQKQNDENGTIKSNLIPTASKSFPTNFKR